MLAQVLVGLVMFVGTLQFLKSREASWLVSVLSTMFIGVIAGFGVGILAQLQLPMVPVSLLDGWSGFLVMLFLVSALSSFLLFGIFGSVLIFDERFLTREEKKGWGSVGVALAVFAILAVGLLVWPMAPQWNLKAVAWTPAIQLDYNSIYIPAINRVVDVRIGDSATLPVINLPADRWMRDGAPAEFEREFLVWRLDPEYRPRFGYHGLLGAGQDDWLVRAGSPARLRIKT